MRSSQLIKILFPVIILSMIITFGVRAFADTVIYENYDPSYPEISYDEMTTSLVGTWERGELSSKYDMVLYKGSKQVLKKTVSGSSYDFSSFVVSKKGGTGKYKFSLHATKNPDAGAVFMSDEYEVESNELKEIKARVQKEQAEKESAQRGWIYYMNGEWKYYDDTGKPLKNTWLDENGKRYHFATNGVMQTGWQTIDKKWYYFDNKGALLVNTTTPDGYTVNANGEWIDGSGHPVSSQGAATTPATMTTLVKVSIGVSEQGKTPGQIKEVKFTDGTGVKIVSTEFSKPYEQWKAGEQVKVKLVVQTTSNYQFGKKTTFSVRGAKSIAATGSGDTRTINFSYYPKTQLTEPTGLYVDDAGNLKWDKVPNAASYKIVITYGGVQVESDTITENEFWMGEYLDLSYEPDEEVMEKISDANPTVNIKLTAMASSKKQQYFLTSNTVNIADVRTWSSSNTLEGELKKTGDKLTYSENGVKYNGWKLLKGYWYYFDKGTAVGPGWVEDHDDIWYYFDDEHRMLTGTIVDGDKEYFLNDGSNPNLPIGAYKE